MTARMEPQGLMPLPSKCQEFTVSGIKRAFEQQDTPPLSLQLSASGSPSVSIPLFRVDRHE